MITYSFVLELVEKQLGVLYCTQEKRFPGLVGKKFYFAIHQQEQKKIVLVSEYRNKQTVIASYKYDSIN